MTTCPRCSPDARGGEFLLCPPHAAAMTPAERFELYSKLEGTRRVFQGYVFVDMPDAPCPTCGSTRRVNLAELQDRSADEGGTMYYLCENNHQHT